MKHIILYCLGLSLLGGLFTFVGLPHAAAFSTINVTTTDDSIVNDGFCSLREAIISANENDSPGIIVGECPAGSADATDIIQVQAGVTYVLTLDGSDEEMAYTGDLDVIDNAGPMVDVRIQAVGEGTAVIQNGGMTDRIWHIHEAGFELAGIEVTGGNVNAAGGGLLNEDGQVTIADAIFSLNTGIGGGAVHSKGDNAELRLQTTDVTRNNSINFSNGGGVSVAGGLLIATDSNIAGNMAMGNGGGLVNQDGSVTITRTRFSGNTAGKCGGAVANLSSGVVTLITSTITGVNTAEEQGGGICNKGNMSITVGTAVETNQAKKGGGGIYNSGTLTLRNSLVQNNKALDENQNGDGLGGGLYATADSMTTMTQSAIVDNLAASAGGGVATDGNLLAFNSTMSGNFGTVAGGLFVSANGTATLVNVTLADNEGLNLAGMDLHVLQGTVYAGNTIIANTIQDAATCTNSGGTLSSMGHNLTNDDTCFTETTDISNSDPLLAPLANGVHEPQFGSPAIDAGDMVLCSETAVQNMDQNNQPRPAFARCDIGAVEWQGFSLYLPAIMQ